MTQDELLERLNDPELKAIVAKYVGDEPEQEAKEVKDETGV